MKKRIQRLLTLLTALLLALSLAACGGNAASDASAESSLPVSTNEDGLTVSDSRITYPGFTDRELDWDHRTLTLSNDESNEVNFVFTVLSGGDTLYTSDPVAPGESVKWDAISAGLKSGDQQVTIQTTAVQEDGTELNTVSQTITLNIPAAD